VAAVGGAVAIQAYRINSRSEQRAKEDRELAAKDREQAAEDHRLAAVDRTLAEEERLARLEELRRSQATKVVAWFTCEMSYRLAIPHWVATVRNSSDLPIYDVRVSFHFVQEKPDGRWNLINRGGPKDPIRVAPPQQDRNVTPPIDLLNQMGEINENMYVIELEFRDAAGNVWRREPEGGLSEVK
jgi:hypothetical protein